MHMQYPSPFDAYGLPDAATMAAAFGGGAASIDCTSSAFAGGTPHSFFSSTTDSLKGVDFDANMKSVVQQSHLANLMTNFTHFQTSANITSALGLAGGGGASASSLGNSAHNQSSSSNSSPSSIRPMRRKARPLPDQQKSPSYLERRRKNNDSARRSRELRRQKEEENERRRHFLEQEVQRLNIQLQQAYHFISQLQLVCQQQHQQQPRPIQPDNPYNFR